MDVRAESYFANERPEVTQFLPYVGARVLDIGCGEGRVSDSLRARGAQDVTGLEYVPEAAERARSRLDHVLVGDAAAIVPTLPRGSFDLVLAYDVLEHLVDPEAVVSALPYVMKPEGLLHVSVPNARSLVLLRNLVVRGTFGYEPSGGLCDATHLRWFTRRDMAALLRRCGFRVLRVDHVLGRWGKVGVGLSLGLGRDFVVGQYYFLARPA